MAHGPGDAPTVMSRRFVTWRHQRIGPNATRI